MNVRRIGIVAGLATVLSAGLAAPAAAAEDPPDGSKDFTMCKFVGSTFCDTAGTLGGGKLGTGIKDACDWVVTRECDRKPPFEDPPLRPEDETDPSGPADQGDEISTEEPPASQPTKVGPANGVEWEQNVPASCELQVAVLCGQFTSLLGEFGKPLKKQCKKLQILCSRPIRTRPIVVAPGLDECPAGTHEVGDGCVRDEPAEEQPPAAAPAQPAAMTCPPGYHDSPEDIYDWCWADDGSGKWVDPVPTS